MEGAIRAALGGTGLLALALALVVLPARAEASGDLPPPRILDADGREVGARPPRAAPRRADGTAPGGALPDGPASGPDAPLERPSLPPPRPREGVEPRPEDVVFEVERPGGVFRRFPDGEGRAVFVMIGNPRIQGFEHRRPDGRLVPPFWIKANRMVLWVDLERFEPLGVLGGGADDEASDGPDQAESVRSLLQEAVKGIYAEGAVELRYGDLEFRAERLHLEPGTYQALLVEPRFDGKVTGQGIEGTDLPLHVRAQRARLVAKGVAVFDQADVGTVRTFDRFGLEVRTLTVEELREEGAGGEEADPDLLGFRNLSAQTYRAEGTQLRGEGLPLFYLPDVEFGYPSGEGYPLRFRRFSFGRRSNLGWYGTAGVGGPLGPPEDPWAEWTAILGGYTERGPSGSLELDWDRPRSEGRLVLWSVYDFDPVDFNGYEAPEHFRWKVNFENKTQITDALEFQGEFNQFADRGLNLEYDEADQLTHKDRESYGRLRYERGSLVGTLIGKWHERQFVTETTELPQLSLWFTSVPLLTPRSRSGLGLDLQSTTRAGWLARRFDEDVTDPDYAAWRLQTDTRLYGTLDVGDVRLVGYTGVYAADYLGRDDGEDDVFRAALLGGVRGNLQLHRTWGARGGLFDLDRLRHVVDVDVEGRGWWFNDTDAEDVPYFEETDEWVDRREGVLRVRNRVQTRDPGGGIRNVVDLELSGHWYVDDVGPHGLMVPGEIDYVLRSEPRRGLVLGGEGRWDLERDSFYRASIGGGGQFAENWALFAGFRYIRGTATQGTFDISWRWSRKYGVRFRQVYDFRVSESQSRLVFGRYASDHAIFFGANLRKDDVGIELSFQPTLGGIRPGRRYLFTDQPDTDPWDLIR